MRDSIQVGGNGSFERRQVILFLGSQIAEAIEDYHDQLGFGFQRQFGIKSVKIHPDNLRRIWLKCNAIPAAGSDKLKSTKAARREFVD
jgi:hypothetical protein